MGLQRDQRVYAIVRIIVGRDFLMKVHFQLARERLFGNCHCSVIAGRFDGKSRQKSSRCARDMYTCM